MSLSQPFGVDRLVIGGSFQAVADHVVPNEACADIQGLKGKLSRYPAIPDFLRKFEARGLAFSIASLLSPRSRIDTVFADGKRTMAREATIRGRGTTSSDSGSTVPARIRPVRRPRLRRMVRSRFGLRGGALRLQRHLDPEGGELALCLILL